MRKWVIDGVGFGYLSGADLILSIKKMLFLFILYFIFTLLDKSEKILLT